MIVARWLVAGIVLVALGAYALSFPYWQSQLTEPSLAVSIPDGAAGVEPGTPIGLTASGRGIAITGASLTRATLDAQGDWGAEQPVPVHVAVQPSGTRPGATLGRVLGVADAEPVQPDARYTLLVQARAAEIQFPVPWPRDVPLERRVQFTTLRSPRLAAPQQPVSLRYGQPIPLKWTLPMQQVEASANPAAAVRVQLDPHQPSVGRLELGDFQGGQRYTVTINGGLAANGVPLQQPYTLTVLTPLYPRAVLPSGPITLRPGEQRVTLHWNTPLAEMEGSVGPAVQSRFSIDPRDPQLAYFDLDGYAQGRTYTVTIDRAIARSGAPLQSPVTFTVQTPPAVKVTAASPAAGAVAPVDTAPRFTFSEPIRSRDLAEQAITAEPAVPHHFEWSADGTSVTFVPDGGWPWLSNIKVTLAPGAQPILAQSGAYLEGEAAVSFSTPTDKKIEVNLTEQKMYLWQGGELVRTFPVATGVAAAPTPPGDYTVQYKMAETRFRGVNPDGSHYDIPDVHWVMAFMGDYTIHGAYWRHAFGRPGSDGCVSLTDANAKIVFDWTPEGTPLSIHY